jgi:hypothetical protein
LAEIASVIGRQATLSLAEAVGGTRVYIPALATDDHWLVKAIGRELANKLCDHFSVSSEKDTRRGQRIEIPNAPATGAFQKLRDEVRNHVGRLDQEGKSSRQIALEVGITQRAVHRFRSSAKKKSRAK